MKRVLLYLFVACFVGDGVSTVHAVEKKEKQVKHKIEKKQADKKKPTKKATAAKVRPKKYPSAVSGTSGVRRPPPRAPFATQRLVPYSVTHRKFDRLVDRNRNGIDDRREQLKRKAIPEPQRSRPPEKVSKDEKKEDEKK